MVTSTNQPTDQPTDQPGEYRAICLFQKLENRKKAEICNLQFSFKTVMTPQRSNSKTKYFTPLPYD